MIFGFCLLQNTFMAVNSFYENQITQFLLPETLERILVYL